MKDKPQGDNDEPDRETVSNRRATAPSSCLRLAVDVRTIGDLRENERRTGREGQLRVFRQAGGSGDQKKPATYITLLTSDAVITRSTPPPPPVKGIRYVVPPPSRYPPSYRLGARPRRPNLKSPPPHPPAPDM